jgi:putative redox protein
MEIAISFPGGKKVDAKINGHIIHTDQSVQAGGSGSAPEPFSYFLASIGTCAGIYVLGFCEARQIPTHGISLKQLMSLDAETHRIKEIKIEIMLPPDFPVKYLSGVKHAAEHCAVKKTILNPPAFTIETVVAS